MPGVNHTKEMNVAIENVFKAITAFKDYPKFVTGCTKTEIISQTATKAEVKYTVNMIKEVQYTLILNLQSPTSVSWTLKEGSFFKKNTGGWELKSLGPKKTKVTYSLDIEVGMFVPKMIIDKLTGSSLPTMMQEFETYAQKL